MRLVIQRVKEASVSIDGKVVSAIGQLLAVSQFTLTASTKKGNRPSYIRAAGHELAVPLYDKFCLRLSEIAGRFVQKGVFGADMQCALVCYSRFLNSCLCVLS